ncbi:MAG: ribonuclease Z [Ruminococcaceae bacterium]|nr:ribonuclease Z [Oscillospiraceae bacterium]
MKITFLGSGHGFVEPNRKCTSIMVEVNGKYYFVDAGTAIMDEIKHRHIDIHDVNAVYITHPHTDHSEGLVSFVTLLSWYHGDANPKIFIPRESMKEGLEKWIRGMQEYYRENMEFVVFAEGDIYDDGIVKVSAIPNEHCYDSYSFVFEADGKKILFSGDIKYPDVDFPERAFNEKFDLIVIEAAHFYPHETEETLAKCDVDTVIYNHIAPRADNELAEMEKKSYPYKCIRSYDGMEFVL